MTNKLFPILSILRKVDFLMLSEIWGHFGRGYLIKKICIFSYKFFVQGYFHILIIKNS